MNVLANRAKAQTTILFWFIAVLWVLELVDQIVFGRSLDVLGIRPRSVTGLWGILLAPFLHGGLAHLVANTVPLFVLGWFVMLRRISDFFVVSLVVILLGGLGVWLFGGPNTVHLGASGLIFGYLGYLLLRGFFEHSFGAIALSVAVGLLYGGAIWGVLPSRPGISWEGHLFGFLAGVAAARFIARSP